jgi:hypothetical protein
MGYRITFRIYSQENNPMSGYAPPNQGQANESVETKVMTKSRHMQIFYGAMTGIRNPKAHANIQIDAVRSIHFMFLASLLLSKIDERIP